MNSTLNSIGIWRREVFTDTLRGGLATALAMALLILFSSVARGQMVTDPPTQVLQLNAPQPGSNSYINKASELIHLQPGYSYRPDAGSGNFMHAFIDPHTITPATYSGGSPSGSGEDWPPQIDPSKAVGFTPGAHGVSPTGAATYDIPIQLPPGTAGMVPSLSISYNSQGGNGLLGLGWNMGGLSAITRVPKTLYHDQEVRGVMLDDEDVYALDGNRLIRTEGSAYGQEGCIYGTEQETFAKIISHGHVGNKGPEWFEVKTKDGMTLEYGNTPDSRFTTQGDGAVIVHRINRMTDQYGNYITFKYRTVDRQSVIDEIRYTGNDNAGVQPYNVIRFEYMDRDDRNTVYVMGPDSDVKSNLLLRKVRIVADGQHFKNYVFEYGTNGMYSFLKKVTESGSNGEELNSTVMRYGENVPMIQAFESNVITSNTSISTDGVIQRDNVFSGDFNGDGYTDLITAISNSYVLISGYSYLHSFNFFINDHSNQFSQPVQLAESEIGIHPFVEDDVNQWPTRTVYVGDFTGDGKDDFLILTTTNVAGDNGQPGGNRKILSIKIWTYSITGLALIQNFSQDFFGSHLFLEQALQFGDFNGDGVTDILTITGRPTTTYPYYIKEGRIIISRIDGSGFDYLPIVAFDNHYTDADPEIPENIIHVSTLDYNGDGQSDLMISTPFETTIFEFDQVAIHVLFRKLYEGLIPNGPYSHIKFGDFNGDGKTDFLGKDASGSWSIVISMGVDGFVQALFNFNHTVNVSGTHPDQVLVADFDGDGRSDILHEYKENQQQVIGLYSQIQIDSEIGATNSHYINPSYSDMIGQHFLLGDFNADGNCDLFSNEWGPEDGGNLYLFHADDQHHLLHSVSNGLGVDVTFDYGWITHGADYALTDDEYPFPVQRIIPPIDVVTSMSEPNGTGSYHQTDFQYRDAIAHRHGKGFLGFSRFIQKTEALNRRKEDQFTLDEPSMTTHLSRAVTSQTNGGLVSTSIYDNQVVPIGNNRFWTRPNSITTLDHVSGFSSTVTHVYDSNGDGNIIETTEQNAVERTTTQYSQWVSAGSFRPNKPQRIDITKERTFGSEPAIARTSTFSYDLPTGGLLSSTKDPGDHSLVTTYVLDDFGNVTEENQTIVGQDSRITAFEFDQKGRFPIVKTNAIGLSEHFEYDGRWGKVTKSTSYGNLITTSTYDAFGNLASVISPTGLTTVMSRNWDIDPSSNTVYSVTTVSPGLPSTTVGFDIFDRELKISTDGYNQEILAKRKFDTKGRIDHIISEHASGGVEQPITSVCSYDGFDRLSSVSDGIRSTTVSYSPPAPGWTTKITTDPSGQEHQEITDEAGRVIHTEDGGGELDFHYNSHGLPRQIIDGDGNTLVSMEFNEVGRQKKLIDIDGGITEYRYNAFDELVYQKDALGNETVIEYDRLGRVVSKDNSVEGITHYLYVTSGNGVGKLRRVTAPNGSYRELQYDAQGRIISEKTVMDQEEFEYSYSYDVFGNIASLTYPSGYTVNSEYNPNGFLTSVKEGQSSTELFALQSMNAKGQVTGYALGNGDNVVKTFDDYGLPVTETSDILHRVYAFDAATGNLDSRDDTERSLHEWFQYDGLSRLEESEVMFDNGSGFTYPYYPVHVDYSGNGNIEFKTDAGEYEYDPSRIHAVSSISNEEQNISYITQDLTYTATNRTASIVEGLNEMHFTYGPDGNRLKSVLSIYEEDGNGGTQVVRTETRYYAGSYEKLIIEEAGETQVYELHYVQSPVGLTAIHVKQNGAQGHTFYVYSDHLGSITELTDENGDVVLEQNFDAWGRRRNPNNWTYNMDSYLPPIVPSNIPDPKVWLNRGYTGHEHLDEFVLINMNNRMYDPTIGRMLAVDNYISDSYSTQAFNRYSYVLNNPLKYVDPTGEFPSGPPGSFSYSYSFSSYSNSTGYGASFSMSYSFNFGNGFSGSGSINSNLSFNTETGIFSGNVCLDGNVVSSTIGTSAFSESASWSYRSDVYSGTKLIANHYAKMFAERYPAQMFVAENLGSFATGIGSDRNYYGPEDYATKAIRQSPGIQMAIDAYINGTYNPQGYGYQFSPSTSSVEAFINSVPRSIDAHVATGGDLVQLFTGSYKVEITPINMEGHVSVKVINETSINSLFYHMLGSNRNYYRTGYWGYPGSSVFQEYQWIQSLRP